MKLKIKDPVFGLDADGEPVAGRVAGIDQAKGLVTISPSVCGPLTVKLADCQYAGEPPAEAPAPPAPTAVPEAPPTVPPEPLKP